MAVAGCSVVELAPGLELYPDYLERSLQENLLSDIRAVVADAPLFRPTMPRSGAPFSVAMTNCGELGWISDARGYRYDARHPVTGRTWPAMPRMVTEAWDRLSTCPAHAQACLVNYYAGDARMGLHQDRDEEDRIAPVVSLSLGDTAVFRYGGVERRSPTKSVKLRSGDALVIGGASRLVFHGIDRILAGSSSLLEEGGRLNLTIRRVSPVPPS